METIDNKIFTRNEKQIIYSLLTRVMDADKVRRGEEVSYQESIAEALTMTTEDITLSNELSLEECKEELPGLRGFGESQLKNMRLFYEAWSMLESNPPIAIGGFT